MRRRSLCRKAMCAAGVLISLAICNVAGAECTVVPDGSSVAETKDGKTISGMHFVGVQGCIYSYTVNRDATVTNESPKKPKKINYVQGTVVPVGYHHCSVLMQLENGTKSFFSGVSNSFLVCGLLQQAQALQEKVSLRLLVDGDGTVGQYVPDQWAKELSNGVFGIEQAYVPGKKN